MTTFPLGWLDLHHSESVLGLQPGEVGFAFSPLRTYRWKCYYKEEARTIVYQFCQTSRNLILSASRLASSFSLSSFTFLARSAYACKEINEHVLCQACKVLCLSCSDHQPVCRHQTFLSSARQRSSISRQTSLQGSRPWWSSGPALALSKKIYVFLTLTSAEKRM